MAEEGAVISCHTIDEWTEQLQMGNDSEKLFLIPDFHTLNLPRSNLQHGIGTLRSWTDITLQVLRRELSHTILLYQIVVDFTASWCGPCRFITPFLVELAKKLPHVTFLKVDVEELKQVDWAVEAMPTFIFLKEGRIVDKVVGAKKEELQHTIAKHMTAVASAATATATATATALIAVSSSR